jgi:hypothetical protein
VRKIDDDEIKLKKEKTTLVTNTINMINPAADKYCSLLAATKPNIKNDIYIYIVAFSSSSFIFMSILFIHGFQLPFPPLPSHPPLPPVTN